MKYFFGIVDRSELETKLLEIENNLPKDYMKFIEEDFSEHEIIMGNEYDFEYLLAEKGIFKKIISDEKIRERLIELNIPESEIDYEIHDTHLDIPSILLHEIYEHICDLYISKSEHLKLDFFDNFQDIIYGMDFTEMKKIALMEFKKIYQTVNLTNPTKSFIVKTAQNEKFVYTPTYLHKLAIEKQSIINKINTYSLLPYLYGDISLQNEYPYYNEDLINDIISFQIKVDILLELNNRFNFEIDIYFNNMFEYSLKAHTQLDNFKSITAYVFTMVTIKKFDEINRSNLESLFSFLKINKLYIGKTDSKFLNLVNMTFYEQVKDLKNHDPQEENTLHAKRVTNLENEWKIFNQNYFPEG
ncbi:hypothetical protein [Flavobacterium sp. PL12]|uniref:hypothetical protein n=1 Tax=Flavobacterium sp. PL12 TaxID=3071718 RepID=UPI00319E60E3